MDLGAVAIIAGIAGLAGGAVGAGLVGTVEGVLRQRQVRGDHGVAAYSSMHHFYGADIDPERVRHQVIVRPGQSQPSTAIDHLDVDSRRVVTLARQEAIQGGHSHIGSESLAMALRLYANPLLDRIWSELAIDPEMLRRRIEAAVPPTPGTFPTKGGFTERVSRIVRMAHDIATERKQEEVAPVHLLIALADEGGGTGADVLASLGATPQRIREIVDGPES